MKGKGGSLRLSTLLLLHTLKNLLLLQQKGGEQLEERALRTFLKNCNVIGKVFRGCSLHFPLTGFGYEA
jgi:hypothetical protein